MDKDEKKLTDFQKQKENSDKMLLNVEIVLGTVVTVSLLIILLASLYAIYELNLYVLPIIMIIVAFAMFIIGVIFCLHIEQKAGYYKCNKCQHKYVPTFNQTMWSMHIFRTRYMKCPHCNQRSWSKKVI